MNVEQALFQFIDFYLLPSLSQKSIDLLKIRLDRKTKKIEDPMLKQVTLIREALRLLENKRKPNHAYLSFNSEVDPLYFHLLQLKPKDCLIFASRRLFYIPILPLSMALQTSAESLEFRCKQLHHQFEEDGFHPSQVEISSLPTQTQANLQIPRSAEQFGVLANFQKLPLALRFTIETGLILMSLLGLLWLIPEIRNRYENSIQKRINDYLIESSLVDSPAPVGTTKTAKLLSADEISPPEEEDESVGSGKSSSSDELSSRKQPKVNEGETWRFSFTGSGTSEIESGIINNLQKLNITSEKPLTVPGGIQFNFVLPVEKVIPLKNSLELAVNDLQQKTVSKGNGQNLASFSWYKKRNMGTRKIPTNHVQVIIWISTL